MVDKGGSVAFFPDKLGTSSPTTEGWMGGWFGRVPSFKSWFVVHARIGASFESAITRAYSSSKWSIKMFIMAKQTLKKVITTFTCRLLTFKEVHSNCQAHHCMSYGVSLCIRRADATPQSSFSITEFLSFSTHENEAKKEKRTGHTWCSVVSADFARLR